MLAAGEVGHRPAEHGAKQTPVINKEPFPRAHVVSPLVDFRLRFYESGWFAVEATYSGTYFPAE
jgi:hypothetical protein